MAKSQNIGGKAVTSRIGGGKPGTVPPGKGKF